MHERVVDNFNGLENATDKQTLDKLLEKLRRAILEMDNNLTELRSDIGKNLTKKEYDTIIQKIFVGVARGMMILHHHNIIHKNLTKENWTYVKADGTQIPVMEGRSAAIAKDTKIDFGELIGEFR